MGKSWCGSAINEEQSKDGTLISKNYSEKNQILTLMARRQGAVRSLCGRKKRRHDSKQMNTQQECNQNMLVKLSLFGHLGIACAAGTTGVTDTRSLE